MPESEFVFTVHLSEDRRFDEMLGDLTRTVMRHAGYADAAIAAVSSELTRGVADARARVAGCDIEFRAHAGELVIVVTQGGRRILRTSHRLP